MILVDHGDHISGVIQVDATQEDFQIVGGPSGQHRLIKMKRNRIPSCGMLTNGPTEKRSPVRVPSAQTGSSELTAYDLQIDVLAIVHINGGMSPEVEDFIRTSIAMANTAFDYSNVGAFYNLVTIEVNPAGFSFVGGLFDYWRWMNNNGSGAPMIEALRTAAHADMVTLFVDVPSEYCGVANLRYLGDQGDEVYVEGFPDILWADQKPAYSVQRIGCGLNDYTFAHELGHNFGLRHDCTDPNTQGEIQLLPPLAGDDNPRGYEFTTWMGPRATVMGCFGQTVPCYRTHYYSDPLISWYGLYPTGNENEPYRANAATILRGRKFEYSRLRARP